MLVRRQGLASAGQAEQRVEHMQDHGRVRLLLPSTELNKSGEHLGPLLVIGEDLDGETARGLAQHRRVGMLDELQACLNACVRR